ncbi:MAG: hypothetical protein JWP81_3684 [Ferruginibacter sp.]|nr:hypothetical protein [Ferruginibacter sp.]
MPMFRSLPGSIRNNNFVTLIKAVNFIRIVCHVLFLI